MIQDTISPLDTTQLLQETAQFLATTEQANLSKSSFRNELASKVKTLINDLFEKERLLSSGEYNALPPVAQTKFVTDLEGAENALVLARKYIEINDQPGLLSRIIYALTKLFNWCVGGKVVINEPGFSTKFEDTAIDLQKALKKANEGINAQLQECSSALVALKREEIEELEKAAVRITEEEKKTQKLQVVEITAEMIAEQTRRSGEFDFTPFYRAELDVNTAAFGNVFTGIYKVRGTSSDLALKDVKDPIEMKQIIRQKFFQDPMARDLLLATKNSYLVEHPRFINPEGTEIHQDYIFGDSPKIVTDKDGVSSMQPGDNKLGIILMEIRQELAFALERKDVAGIVLPTEAYKHFWAEEQAKLEQIQNRLACINDIQKCIDLPSQILKQQAEIAALPKDHASLEEKAKKLAELNETFEKAKTNVKTLGLNPDVTKNLKGSQGPEGLKLSQLVREGELAPDSALFGGVKAVGKK
jgi:hypothetical protein